jgi:methylmalonyl-CoA mutase N-terminal domain/subunit
MSGAMPLSFPPFDEPLGLGHSLEAVQLNLDATRIMIHEAKIADVNDPWAGSYMMEALTDEIEEGAWAEFDKIEKMGGAVAAIESGYMQKAVAKSAYERQKRIERQEDLVVGVNCFNDENEIDVTVNRAVEETYDEEAMSSAEDRQREALGQLKRDREDRAVKTTLTTLRAHAGDESVNLMPDILACVKAEATLQEICDVLREIFGEAQPVRI